MTTSVTSVASRGILPVSVVQREWQPTQTAADLEDSVEDVWVVVEAAVAAAAAKEEVVVVRMSLYSRSVKAVSIFFQQVMGG